MEKPVVDTQKLRETNQGMPPQKVIKSHRRTAREEESEEECDKGITKQPESN